MGVYSHARSPLKKAASTNYLRDAGNEPDSRQRSTAKREGSPLKRVSLATGTDGENPFNAAQHRMSSYTNRGVGRRESGRF
jgi:hypothetical protein